MAPLLLPAGPDSLHRFTRESLTAIENRIAEEQARNAKQEYREDTGAEEEVPQPRADLEAGKQLPRIFGDIPSDIVGVPLDDIDPFYFNNKKQTATGKYSRVKDCAYGEEDEMVRLVFDTNSAKLREKVLSARTKVTLNTAMDIARDGTSTAGKLRCMYTERLT
ncbi:SCN2A protein, partial [Polypterus senegalus]